MATRDEVLGILKQFPQDSLKAVIAEAVFLIEHPERGIGTKLFEALFRLVPQPCVELVIVDKIGTPSKVLIIRRAKDDPTYPGALHCPGTYIRLGETDFSAMERCVRKELGPNVEIVDYKIATQYNDPRGCAGEDEDTGRQRHTVGNVYLVQISGELTTAVENKWASFIPRDVLSGHKAFLRKALGWEISNQPLFG